MHPGLHILAKNVTHKLSMDWFQMPKLRADQICGEPTQSLGKQEMIVEDVGYQNYDRQCH